MTQPIRPSVGSIDDAFMNHKQYAGEVIPDPWDDPNQVDWPMNSKEVEDGLDSDAESGTAS